MIKANFILDFDSEEETNIIAESVAPEIEKKIPKTKVFVKKNKKSYEIQIQAADLSSLRAACNSYLRWINTAFNVKKKL